MSPFDISITVELMITQEQILVKNISKNIELFFVRGKAYSVVEPLYSEAENFQGEAN